jgi:hypothetical protein
MPSAHSHPHSPSPTSHTNGNPPTTTAPPASIRRNLFSTHLSRRPASSSQPPVAEQWTVSVSFIPPLSPTRSPTRSPGGHTDAIIATHPNGRPVLPTLPRLPAHLRLSTTSEEDALDNPSGNNTPTRYNLPVGVEEEEHEDRARIEKGLVEMMWRQRQRANHAGGGTQGPREKSREEEELRELIMENLKEKVNALEGEAWMFGERGEEG